MNDIILNIQDEIQRFGYKAKTVSITHLSELQESVAGLIRQGLINKRLHENWHFYLETNENLPEAKTIVIVAMPQPVTRIRFKWQGIEHPAEIAPNYINRADESRAEEILYNTMVTAGYRIAKARLPLKTLAVRSGLASYGRNNISYVPGMGSFCRLIAFYTDFPCEEDNWQESKMMPACESCSLCHENCPTGSIVTDRFLIHAEKCLGFLNETDPDTPHWVQLQLHWLNAFIGCMSCQFVCPENKPYLNNFVTGPSLSEEETALILDKTPLEKLPPEIIQKLQISGAIYPLLARNLIALIEKQKKYI